MKQIPLIIAIYLFSGCHRDSTSLTYESKGIIAGEWKFVNQFSENQQYSCQICPDFVFDKVENILNLNKDLSLNGRIGALIYQGNYVSKEESNTFNPQIYRDLFSAKGTFSLGNFQVLNKPLQTEEQTKLIDAISNANTYILYTNIQQSLQLYDQLKLYSTPSEYLLFVRKKLN